MPNPERLLVFQTAYLGDVVLTTPLLSALKARFPDASCDIAVQPAWEPLVRHHPAVSEVLTFDKWGTEAGTAGLLGFAARLRRRGYTRVYCPHPSFRSGLLLALAGIGVRIGFHDAAGALFHNRIVWRDASLHEADRVLSLLAQTDGCAGPAPRPLVALPPELDVAALRRRFEIPAGRLLGLHPGSVWATKRWPAPSFAQVGRTLADRFEAVLVFGGPQEEAVSASVAAEIGVRAINLGGRLKLAELAALLSCLSVFVTNDSGPMHIAAAFGVPTVAIFGATVPGFGYTPYGTRSRVLGLHLPCRPCGPHGGDHCPEDHFLCMRGLHIEEVVQAVLELLAGG